ncbi:hypothetical protein M0805_009590 [Coniferiporia weirii]|nr:hypothetical protein M0805_009590 [Coniferiporia weirii]
MSPKSISVSEMPTLRQLYAERKLRSHLDRISLIQADITTLQVDAIVNAAKSNLLVDGAIHSAAGPLLKKECAQLGGCAVGDAKITRGYNLPAKCVIHTVGPMYDDKHADRQEKELASCYYTSLKLASQHRLRTIAFPAISTGIYRYPLEDATRVALGVARQFLPTAEGDEIDLIIFTMFNEKERKVFERLVPEFFPSAL